MNLFTTYGADVRRYLRDDAPGPAARARWTPVLAVLGTQAPAGQALSTPLMVGLARAIYNPRPGELAGTMPDPAELRSFADRAAVEAHLFDQFIPAAYRAFTKGRWTARQAGTWLTFLARHLEQTVGSPDLAWWHLQKAVPRTALWLGFGLVFGLVGGLGLGLVSGLGLGLGAGLEAGFGFGLVVGLVGGLMFGFGQFIGLAGLVVGLAGGSPDLPVRSMRINTTTLRFGLVVGLVGGLVGGARGRARERARERARGRALGQARVRARGRARGWARVWALVRPRVRARDGARAGLAGGLVFGLAEGLAGAAGRPKWASYMLARGWLVIRHRLPWSLMDFLDNAHQRGVLRQTGAVYQFRHIDLQHRLATRP